MKTLQQAFDAIVTHALTHRTRSWCDDDQICMYRQGRDASSTTRCFVGALIDDADYYPDLEGLQADEPEVGRVLKESGWPTVPEFYEAAQNIHDDYEPAGWADQLVELGADHNLDVSIVERFRGQS
jgi:hypothetical protein